MNKTVIKFIPMLQVIALVLLILASYTILQMVNQINSVNRENNAYLRTVSCVLSVPLSTRTSDYISNCYLKAELTTGTKVDHFGNK